MQTSIGWTLLILGGLLYNEYFFASYIVMAIVGVFLISYSTGSLVMQ